MLLITDIIAAFAAALTTQVKRVTMVWTVEGCGFAEFSFGKCVFWKLSELVPVCFLHTWAWPASCFLRQQVFCLGGDDDGAVVGGDV